MDGPAFASALRRAWLPAVLAFVVIVVGSFVYVKQRIPPGAQASVAVRDALSVNGGSNTSAAVAFDAIVQSDRLAKVVGQRLGMQADQVKGALSVTTVASTSGIDISPLYVIHAKAKTVGRAEAIVNAAITQGRALYAQLNSTDPVQAKADVASELRAANQTLADATKAYDDFVAASGGDHAPQIAALSGVISTLTGEIAQVRIGGSGNPATGGVVVALQAQLDATQAQLSSLEPLQARYQQLSAALTAAQTNVQQATDLQQLTTAATALPIGAQVKVLDQAMPSGDGLLKLLVYVLGFILGALAAMTIVYAEAARQRSRLSPKELVRALGVPALGRIPRHAISGEV
jgi:uncharacterized protein involved in exopolysaccharide biosynthesis